VPFRLTHPVLQQHLDRPVDATDPAVQDVVARGRASVVSGFRHGTHDLGRNAVQRVGRELLTGRRDRRFEMAGRDVGAIERRCDVGEHGEEVVPVLPVYSLARRQSGPCGNVSPVNDIVTERTGPVGKGGVVVVVTAGPVLGLLSKTASSPAPHAAASSVRATTGATRPPMSPCSLDRRAGREEMRSLS
jgi:hypothetical protein